MHNRTESEIYKQLIAELRRLRRTEGGLSTSTLRLPQHVTIAQVLGIVTESSEPDTLVEAVRTAAIDQLTARHLGPFMAALKLSSSTKTWSSSTLNRLSNEAFAILAHYWTGILEANRQEVPASNPLSSIYSIAIDVPNLEAEAQHRLVDLGIDEQNALKFIGSTRDFVFHHFTVLAFLKDVVESNKLVDSYAHGTQIVEASTSLLARLIEDIKNLDTE